MFRDFLKTIVELWRTGPGRVLVAGIGGVIASGTIFYRLIEGWSWVDSLYFTVVTLTTVGYGDLTPTKDISKLFTVAFILVGAGFIVGALNFILRQTVTRRMDSKPRNDLDQDPDGT